MADEFEPYKEKEELVFTPWENAPTDNLSSVELKKQEEEAFIKECEELRQAAIKAGYDEGMAKAQVDIEEKKQVLVKWAKILKNPVQILDDILVQEMIEVIVWLCAHCIGVEISVHPDKLRELFAHIKNELPSLKGDKVFAMHPDDAEWIKAELEDTAVPGLHDILIADPTLSRGDFYLKSVHSELDGRVQTRLFTLFSKYINEDNLIPPIEPQEQ